MQQLAIDYTPAPRRARSTDPVTSKQAAARAELFARGHAARILQALEKLGSGTASEIGRETGLSVEQICRRLVELQRHGRIVVITDTAGQELVRNGYRVWRLAA